MTELSMQNPVFVTYMITAALMVLKVMGQGVDYGVPNAQKRRRASEPGRPAAWLD